jgi:hypothetical protein
MDKQHKIIEPSGPLVAVVMLDGTTELYSLAEAQELKRQGKLLPKVADDKALTEENVYGDDLGT